MPATPCVWEVGRGCWQCVAIRARRQHVALGAALQTRNHHRVCRPASRGVPGASLSPPPSARRAVWTTDGSGVIIGAGGVLPLLRTAPDAAGCLCVAAAAPPCSRGPLAAPPTLLPLCCSPCHPPPDFAGNMKRFVDVFDASTGALAAQVSSGTLRLLRCAGECPCQASCLGLQQVPGLSLQPPLGQPLVPHTHPNHPPPTHPPPQPPTPPALTTPPSRLPPSSAPGGTQPAHPPNPRPRAGPGWGDRRGGQGPVGEGCSVLLFERFPDHIHIGSPPLGHRSRHTLSTGLPSLQHAWRKHDRSQQQRCSSGTLSACTLLL